MYASLIRIFKEPIQRQVILLVFVLGAAMVLMFVAETAFEHHIAVCNAKLENERARRSLGTAITRRLDALSLSIQRMGYLDDPRDLPHVRLRTKETLDEAAMALRVLQGGGEFVDLLPANSVNRNEVRNVIRYAPAPGQGYVVEAIDILPKLMEIDETVQRLSAAVFRRLNAADAREAAGAGEHIEYLVKQAETYLSRSKECATKILANSWEACRSLEEVKLADQQWVARLRTAIMLGVSVVATAVCAMVCRRVQRITDERREYAEQIEDARRNLFQITEALPVGVAIVGADRRVAEINRSGLEILGAAAAADVVGLPCHRVFHDPTMKGCPFDDASASGATVECEVRTLDGSTRPVLKRAIHMRLQGRDVILEAFMDIAERQQMERALLRANEMQAQIIQTAATAIFQVDSKQRLVKVNRELCRITGFSEEELLGQHCSVLEGDPCRNRCGLFDGGCRGDVYRKQCSIHDRQGRRLTVLKNACLLRDEAGRVTGGIESFTDVTELVEAREQAENANRSKSEFLANMSHEIRTPMNGVMGMIELLLRTELSCDQRRKAETAYHSAEALLGLLNDILDFSKMEAGMIQFDTRPFDLGKLIEEVAHLLAEPARQKDLELILRYPPNLPRRFVGDEGRLRQVLINLVGNAVKFTDAGQVLVSVDVRPAEDGRAEIHLSVADSGIGIPADKVEHIFEKFAQADATTTRKFGGTGLGLAICRGLLEMMDGCVWAESTLGVGSTFHARAILPLCEHDAEAPMSDPAELQGLSVLIVDDNATNREVLEEIVSEWGAVATSAADASEALDAYEHAARAGRPFAVVLVDFMMPGLDGLELCRRLVAREDVSLRAVVMLSSSDHGEQAARCMEIGVDNCLVKPVRLSELRSSLLRALGKREVERRDDTFETLVAGRGLRVLLAEDNPINQEVAVALLHEMDCEVVVAENGREAADLATGGGFDLVLMDLQMPVMGGLEAAEEIRQRADGAAGRLPIVAMTAHAMRDDAEKCRAAGMDGFVTKPVTGAKLAEAINAVVVGDRGQSEPPGPIGEAETAEAEPTGAVAEDGPESSICLDELLGQSLGKPSIVRRVLEKCRQCLPEAIERLEQAFDRGDLDEAARAAHSLKGSASSVACAGLHRSASHMEQQCKAGAEASARTAMLEVRLNFERCMAAVPIVLAELDTAVKKGRMDG